MLKWILLLRWFLWLSLAVFVGWLVWQIIVPSGDISYVLDKRHKSDFIGQFEPVSGLTADKGLIKITGNPVYFNLRAPRPFSKLKLTLRYKPGLAPVIEIGVLQDSNGSRYYSQPLDNQIIDQFYHSEDWGVIQSGATIFLQKQENFSSLKQFLAKPPASAEVAVYNYNVPAKQCRQLDNTFVLSDKINYIVANYQPPRVLSDGFYESQVEFDLRGAAADKNNYKIMISAPGLSGDSGQLQNLEIAMIKAEFSGATWREFFKLGHR